ncbi:MAG: GLPGLI family protein [Niabella sp.]
MRIYIYLLAWVMWQGAVFAQNKEVGKVIYEISCQFKNARPLNFTGELLFENGKTLFTYDKGTHIKGVHKDTLDDNGNRVLLLQKPVTSGSIGKSVYSNFEDNQQISRELIASKAFIVSDSIKKPHWVIGKQTKQAGNFKCQDAYTHFYGRDYTVWFTNEIPVSYGPWKLNGLPGLILEAISGDGEVKFLATAVSLINSLSSKIEPPSSGQTIKGYASFRTLQDKHSANTQKRIKALIEEKTKDGKTEMSIGKISPVRFEKELD